MRIALLGDIALIGRYDRTQSPDVDCKLSSIRHLIKDCDFVIANLEAPLTNEKKTRSCKGVYLRSDERNIETLKHLGVTHVTLANNHIYDYGTKGKSDTVRVLNKNGIFVVGLNYGSELLVRGKDRAILDGFCCYSANGLRYGEKKDNVKLLSKKSLETFLNTARETNCLPIASVHFGVEELHFPSFEHRMLFRLMSQNTRFVLHGNHPHAIQGIEHNNGSLLIYSHGNLCFDDCYITSIKGLVVEQTKPERESIVVIIEVTESELSSYEVYGFSDYSSNGQERNEDVEKRVKEYSDAFSLHPAEYCAIREKVVNNHSFQSGHSLKFYLRRLNCKYIGAFINGLIHEKKYRSLFRNYFFKE